MSKSYVNMQVQMTEKMFRLRTCRPDVNIFLKELLWRITDSNR